MSAFRLLLVLVPLFAVWQQPVPDKISKEQYEWLVLVGKAQAETDLTKLVSQHPEWITKEAVLAACTAMRVDASQDINLRATAADGLIYLADRLGGDRERAKSRLVAGVFRHVMSNYSEALAILRPAVPLAEKIADLKLQGDLHTFIAQALHFTKKYKEAIPEYLKAIENLEHADPADRYLPQLYLNAGLMYSRTEQIANAMPLYERGLALADIDPDIKAKICINLGVGYYKLGDFDHASSACRQAISSLERVRNPVVAAAGYLDVGAIYTDQGRLYEAFAMYAEAKELFQQANKPEACAEVSLNTAVALAQAGRYEEAQRLVDEAWKFFKDNEHRRALCTEHTGAIMALAGDVNAIPTLRRARASFEKLGQRVDVADCLVSEAVLLNDSRREVEAIHLYQSAAKIFGDAGRQLKCARALTGAALALARLGKFDDASKSIKETLPLYEKNQTWQDIALCQAILGMICEGNGQFLEAAKRYEAALHQVEQLRSKLPDPELATSAATDFGGLPADLARAYVRANQNNMAFSALQRGKGAVLRQALGTESISANAASVADTEKLSQFLLKQEALIEFAVAEGSTFCFVVRGGHSGVMVHEVSISSRQLEALRDNIAKLGTQEADAEKRLYDLLFKPLEVELAGVKNLILCPDQALHQIPFGALRDANGKFLIERFAITNVSSASTWLACRQIAAARHSLTGSRLLVSISKYSANGPGQASARSGLRDLPYVKQEAELVSKALGGHNDWLQEQAATAEAIKAKAPTASLIHFASHAMPNDHAPGAGVLVVAPSKHGDLGLIYPQDIQKWKLRAGLTVLSACSTSQGRLASGEGLLSLAWSFQIAGCPSIVATRWRVNDEAAQIWVEKFYASYVRGFTKAESVRLACLALLKSRYSRPQYWACWTLMGSDR